MNLQRVQKPYVFRPPRPARWFRPLLHLISTSFLRFRFRIRRLSVKGERTLVQLSRAGQSVLVTPNHADHADPCILVEAGRRIGLALHFMAARECFERSPLNCFVLQRSGAFSVDREGNDLASLRTAMNLLRAGRHPLVIFPEGEIYHHHEELDLLNEGPATIVLRAAEKLPAGRRAYAIPTAIRIRHDPVVQSTFGRRLEILLSVDAPGTPRERTEVLESAAASCRTPITFLAPPRQSFDARLERIDARSRSESGTICRHAHRRSGFRWRPHDSALQSLFQALAHLDRSRGRPALGRRHRAAR